MLTVQEFVSHHALEFSGRALPRTPCYNSLDWFHQRRNFQRQVIPDLTISTIGIEERPFWPSKRGLGGTDPFCEVRHARQTWHCDLANAAHGACDCI